MGEIGLYSVIFLLFIIVINFLHKKTPTNNKNLPPSPPTLPFLGHVHLLKEPFHRSFFHLSQKLGPIFSLHLGSRLAVIVSSPSAVEECFTNNNDIIFANRPYFWVGKYVGYNYSTVSTSPHGDHWRNLRRICKHEIFSNNRLNFTSSIRRDQVKISLQKLHHAFTHDNSVKVELKPLLSELMFNITMRTIGGKQFIYGDKGNGKLEATKLYKLIEELLEVGISPNIGDFFPCLNWVDNLQGYKKVLVRLAREIDVLLQGVINEHRSNEDAFEKENTMISHLLSLQESQPQYYTDEIIKGLVLDMLFGGTNTTVITLEWAMSHLLNNPNALEKSKAEINIRVGQDKLLDEADLPKLRYLHNIISETLRLNPGIPLLIPHVASNQCQIQGYDIPKDTLLLVNAWAIHRDPKLWDDPASFMPERFEEDGRFVGDYKFIPFGVGRRSCPGMGLAQRVVGLVLGSLIQCFEWKRVGGKEIDLMEAKGLNLPKAEPLQALCRARNMANELLS